MNMQNLMAQAQRMQREITKKQEEIYKSTFVGESEWVKITMTGKRVIEKVEIVYFVLFLKCHHLQLEN